MFRCILCGEVSRPGEPSRLLVQERRLKSYPRRSRANRVVWITKEGKRKVEWTDDPGGSGWETAVAVRACESCARSPSAADPHLATSSG